MTNLIRRQIYTRGENPAPDAIHIGEGELIIPVFMPNTAMPNIAWNDFYIPLADQLTDDADAGTGFRLGWGNGDPAWDSSPPGAAPYPYTALEALLGELIASWQFVVPNVVGSLTTAIGTKYDPSVPTTNRIYFEATYSGTNESTAQIRELGLYLNPLADPPALDTDNYLPVADLGDIGEILAIDYISVHQRSPSTSGKIKVVARFVV